jgi:hypothetical protein
MSSTLGYLFQRRELGLFGGEDGCDAIALLGVEGWGSSNRLSDVVIEGDHFRLFLGAGGRHIPAAETL